MTTVAELLKAYESTADVSERRCVIEDLSPHLPHREALDFILGVAESSSARKEKQLRLAVYERVRPANRVAASR
jgi:hypothetical protein